jgi:hypothetical protein
MFYSRISSTQLTDGTIHKCVRSPSARECRQNGLKPRNNVERKLDRKKKWIIQNDVFLLVSTTDNRKTISNFHPTKFRSVQNTMGQITGKSTKGDGGGGFKEGFFFFFIYNIKNDGGFDRFTILRHV